jgi:hypothetical protein
MKMQLARMRVALAARLLGSVPEKRNLSGSQNSFDGRSRRGLSRLGLNAEKKRSFRPEQVFVRRRLRKRLLPLWDALADVVVTRRVQDRFAEGGFARKNLDNTLRLFFYVVEMRLEIHPAANRLIIDRPFFLADPEVGRLPARQCLFCVRSIPVGDRSRLR